MGYVITEKTNKTWREHLVLRKSLNFIRTSYPQT